MQDKATNADLEAASNYVYIKHLLKIIDEYSLFWGTEFLACVSSGTLYVAKNGLELLVLPRASSHLVFNTRLLMKQLYARKGLHLGLVIAREDTTGLQRFKGQADSLVGANKS